MGRKSYNMMKAERQKGEMVSQMMYKEMQSFPYTYTIINRETKKIVAKGLTFLQYCRQFDVRLHHASPEEKRS